MDLVTGFQSRLPIQWGPSGQPGPYGHPVQSHAMEGSGVTEGFVPSPAVAGGQQAHVWDWTWNWPFAMMLSALVSNTHGQVGKRNATRLGQTDGLVKADSDLQKCSIPLHQNRRLRR